MADEQDVKYILSLDGGGIKGAYLARILDKVSEILGEPIQNKFSMIYGTSIGGLIALKLSQLDPTEKFECQSLFVKKNIERIFDKSLLDNTLGMFQWKPIYDGNGKRKVIDETLIECDMSKAKTPVAVTSFKLGCFEPYIFSSWESKECMAVAADATSAAPIYFPPVRHNDDWYVDGGIGVNNPVVMAIIAAKKRWPESRIKVLSIGTGSWFPTYTDDNLKNWGLVEWIKHGLIDMFMSSASRANDMSAELILGDDYIRFNHRKLIDISMDDTSSDTIKKLYQYADESLEEKKLELTKFFK